MPSRTNEQIIEALRESKGLIAVAARRLEVSRRMIYNRLEKSEKVKEALQEARDFTTDVAEAKLFEAIRDGEAWAVCFYLKCQAKKRGYIERQEHTGEGGGPIRHAVDVDSVRDRVLMKLERMSERVEENGTAQLAAGEARDAEFEAVE